MRQLPYMKRYDGFKIKVDGTKGYAKRAMRKLARARRKVQLLTIVKVHGIIKV